MTTALLQMFTTPQTKFCKMNKWEEYTIKMKKRTSKEYTQKLKNWNHKIK